MTLEALDDHNFVARASITVCTLFYGALRLGVLMHHALCESVFSDHRQVRVSSLACGDPFGQFDLNNTVLRNGDSRCEGEFESCKLARRWVG